MEYYFSRMNVLGFLSWFCKEKKKRDIFRGTIRILRTSTITKYFVQRRINILIRDMQKNEKQTNIVITYKGKNFEIPQLIAVNISQVLYLQFKNNTKINCYKAVRKFWGIISFTNFVVFLLIQHLEYDVMCQSIGNSCFIMFVICQICSLSRTSLCQLIRKNQKSFLLKREIYRIQSKLYVYDNLAYRYNNCIEKTLILEEIISEAKKISEVFEDKEMNGKKGWDCL